jgi:CheY-like chemotaxis protein
VLATGVDGGFLLPAGSVAQGSSFSPADCKLDPQGLDVLSGSGEVWMTPSASWQVGNPAVRTQYDCAGQPMVVEYDWGDGHVVWWASSTPLENGSLTRAQNLDFFLNSLGPREGKRFYWDESLHGEVRSTWSYASGPALRMLGFAIPVLIFLVLFSFSRRSGPVRELPPPVRATPLEYLEALGSLYKNAKAASTAVSVAWERFRRHTLWLCGLRMQRMDAAEVAAVVRRRFPNADESLETDLDACEQAAGNEALNPKEALRLVQLLAAHAEKLDTMAGRSSGASGAGHDFSRAENAN